MGFKSYLSLVGYEKQDWTKESFPEDINNVIDFNIPLTKSIQYGTIGDDFYKRNLKNMICGSGKFFI